MSHTEKSLRTVSVSDVIPAAKAYKSRNLLRNFKQSAIIFTFVAPALVLYVWFMLYPMGDAIRLSFFDWNGSSPAMKFVGLDNYKQLANDSIFIRALFTDLYWVIL